MVAKLPAEVLAAFEEAWAGYERATFAASARVAELGMTEPGLDGLGQWALSHARRYVQKAGRILLGTSPEVWSRRPASARFVDGQQDAPPDQLEEPWQPGEPVLLTDRLICRITIHSIPHLTMINPDEFEEPA